jgi:hypothetical protein
VSTAWVPFGLIDVNGAPLSTRPLGIVDSGADSTTFPLEWAKRLGIDHEKDCLEFEGGTAGGPAHWFLYEPGIRATFFDKTLHLGATFAPHCQAVLLGRQDFFRYFKTVAFDQGDEKLFLETVSNWDAATKAVGITLEEIADHIKLREDVASTEFE